MLLLLVSAEVSWYSCNMMFSNKESLNVIETVSNLYVPEQGYVGFDIPVFIAKKYLINT